MTTKLLRVSPIVKTLCAFAIFAVSAVESSICTATEPLIPSPIRFPNEKNLECPDDHFLIALEDKEEDIGRSYTEFKNVDRVGCSRYFCAGK